MKLHAAEQGQGDDRNAKGPFTRHHGSHTGGDSEKKKNKQYIYTHTYIHTCMYNILVRQVTARGRTKEANQKSFVFVHQHAAMM